MMACDAMAGLVIEMYEIADKISRAEKALDDYEYGGLSVSSRAAGLLRKRIDAMKVCHDIIAARIGRQVGEGCYGAEF